MTKQSIINAVAKELETTAKSVKSVKGVKEVKFLLVVDEGNK